MKHPLSKRRKTTASPGGDAVSNGVSYLLGVGELAVTQVLVRFAPIGAFQNRLCFRFGICHTTLGRFAGHIDS